jgi:hypothetical protein
LDRVIVVEQCKRAPEALGSYVRCYDHDSIRELYYVHSKLERLILLQSLRDILLDLIRSKFPHQKFVFGNPPGPVAIAISEKNPGLDILIFDEGISLRLEVGGIANKRFVLNYQSMTSQYGSSAELVIAFLHGIFADQYVVFRSLAGDQGGWRHLNFMQEDEFDTQNFEYFVWSGPYQPQASTNKAKAGPPSTQSISMGRRRIRG